MKIYFFCFFQYISSTRTFFLRQCPFGTIILLYSSSFAAKSFFTSSSLWIKKKKKARIGIGCNVCPKMALSPPSKGPPSLFEISRGLRPFVTRIWHSSSYSSIFFQWRRSRKATFLWPPTSYSAPTTTFPPLPKNRTLAASASDTTVTFLCPAVEAHGSCILGHKELKLLLFFALRVSLFSF